VFLNNSFGQTVDILHRTMDVTLLRRSVIADNIANADTPNFKRSVINFESELGRALDSQSPPAFQAATTNGKHIPSYRPTDYREVGPRRVLDYLSTSDNNGNNVDLEVESMNMLQNQLAYELMTNFVANQFNQLQTAIA
jgi:flagellar basal-body rod protein FlgB